MSSHLKAIQAAISKINSDLNNIDIIKVCVPIEETQLNVQDATIKILKSLGINSRETFNIWKENQGDGKRIEGQKKFYNMVKQQSNTHWKSLKNPTSSVRHTYEKFLLGFKIYNS